MNFVVVVHVVEFVCVLEADLHFNLAFRVFKKMYR